MVFAEFTEKNSRKHYFVGESLSAIEDDLCLFGLQDCPCREITEKEARDLQLGFLDDGIEAIKRGVKNFKLRKN